MTYPVKVMIVGETRGEVSGRTYPPRGGRARVSVCVRKPTSRIRGSQPFIIKKEKKGKEKKKETVLDTICEAVSRYQWLKMVVINDTDIQFGYNF